MNELREIGIVALKLSLAAVFGGIIGYQRELKERPAGFRTHVMVCMGSALFMLVSAFTFGARTDPNRVAAQVVTGIGFLGAGTIIRQGNIVIGLTTAASLWAVAAVGLAVGAGFYSAGIIGTLMIYLALTVFKSIEMRLIAVRREVEHRVMVVEARGVEGQLGRLETLLASLGVEIQNIEIERREDDLSVMRLELSVPPRRSRARIVADVEALKGVQSVRWEESL